MEEFPGPPHNMRRKLLRVFPSSTCASEIESLHVGQCSVLQKSQGLASWLHKQSEGSRQKCVYLPRLGCPFLEDVTPRLFGSTRVEPSNPNSADGERLLQLCASMLLLPSNFLRVHAPWCQQVCTTCIVPDAIFHECHTCDDGHFLVCAA